MGDLAERGLVEIEERDGVRDIDWPRSKVFIDLTNVYVDLKGGCSGGVVETSDYYSLREEAIEVLRSW